MSSKIEYCFDTLDVKVNNLYKLVDQMSQTDTNVLVLGKSGTGKEAMCHLMHMKGPRIHKPYVIVNCAAIPANLIESELFGYVAGAFTGAKDDRLGLLAKAQDGTVVFDEIAEMDLAAQAKLLRVLESKAFFPVGGNEAQRLSARVIATTSRDLNEEIKKGTFREDLFFRLDVVRLHLPTLKQRSKDIPLFADFFLTKLIQENQRMIRFSPEVYHFLCQQEWEGNMRELENFITRLYYFAKTDTLTIHDLYSEVAGLGQIDHQFVVSTKNLPLGEIEKKYILYTMHQVQGNKSQAARTLKISLKTLRSKLKEYDYKEMNTTNSKVVSLNSNERSEKLS